MRVSARRVGQALILGLAINAIGPDGARAQSIFRLSPSLSITEVHDSNLFFAPADRQTDFITRLTPEVEAEYRLPLWTLTGGYAFDAERFAEHRELSRVDARQHAIAGIEYRPSERMLIELGAELSRTQRPGELSPETGLVFGRASAQRSAASVSITRRLTPTRTGTIGYEYSEDRLSGGIAIRAHAATLSTDRRLSLRDTLTSGYRFGEFYFGGPSATSHALSLGWTRAITQHISLSVDGGPNVTQETPGFDTAVTLRGRFKSSEVSMAYARTQTTVFAVAGIVQAQSLGAMTIFRPSRRLQIQLAPAVYRSERGPLQADVYRVLVGAVRELSANFAVEASVDASQQRGGLYQGLASQTIRRHEAIVRLIARPRPRTSTGEPQGGLTPSR
jgi:hypothetical protein